MKITKKVKCLKCDTVIEGDNTCTCGTVVINENTIIKGTIGIDYTDLTPKLLTE